MSSTVSEYEGISSLLDTDLYKLTMQCALLHSGYGDVDVTYAFTNRTPQLKTTIQGFEWLQKQIYRLGLISVTQDELEFLRTKCPYFPEGYLEYLKSFRLKPEKQLVLEFQPEGTQHDGQPIGNISINISGTWAETILYEIPLLILVSEAYFRYSDIDWDYDGQEEKAYQKGIRLLKECCVFSEFGTRRRRSYKAQELVLQGLMRAWEEYQQSSENINDKNGAFIGTSNVHFAHRFDLKPIGTVAHEWFMGIAAITGDYRKANLNGLEKWVSCFGQGVLGIALTDTFGTDQFLKCFKQVRPGTNLTYAEIFDGVRQDSGDPKWFVRNMKVFYTELEKEVGRRIMPKTIVFSDSLNVDLCMEYKACSDEHGFKSSFGVGTDLTNDFHHKSKPVEKSIPLNIVIKLSSAAGEYAVKISDNAGKNTGNKKRVDDVKKEIGYIERTWESGGELLGDERFRWGGAHDKN